MQDMGCRIFYPRWLVARERLTDQIRFEIRDRRSEIENGALNEN